MDDAELRRVFKGPRQTRSRSERPLPDLAWVNRELRRKGVTLQLLWEEYREIHPEGYRYTQFCEYYRRWKRKLDVTMRQSHKVGEKMFVDYAGQTVGVVDGGTGEVREAQIFVAVLGASNYTYAEATWDQSLRSWTGAHMNALEYLAA